LRAVRRLPFILLVLTALAVPSLAAARADATGDGSLVVKRGAAPGDTPVVALDKVNGSGRIIIDTSPSCGDGAVQVSGAGRPKPYKTNLADTAQVWGGSDFTFRAIGDPGCAFTIIVYSATDTDTGRVYLVAAGHGNVRLAGTPGLPTGDGLYSLNDADFRSLPGVQTAKLAVGDAS
jgi:hypothetical protein